MPDVLVTMHGNLTADPELRTVNSGKSVAQFNVASTPRVKRNGEWEDGETVYLRVTVWELLAEGAADNLQKGDAVTVTGKLRQRSFEKDSVKRTVYEIDADTLAKSVRAKRQRQQQDDGPGW